MWELVFVVIFSALAIPAAAFLRICWDAICACSVWSDFHGLFIERTRLMLGLSVAEVREWSYENYLIMFPYIGAFED